jgi:CubicO group peptidase (beta-lactamase class C family)
MRTVDGLCGVVVVVRAGSVVLELAAGPADVEAGAECTPQTRFQIASVSKQFVAAAVMLLAESGKVALDEPVDRWLPGCGPQWRQVTLHHLLTHTSGIGHWGDAPGFDPSQPMNPDQRLALIQQAPLLTVPGTRWHYSSPGYLLIGYILARASGQPYADFITKRILSPLELRSTTVGGVPASAAFARGYRDGEPVPPWDLSAMPGTGDICSTAGDVARYTTEVHSGSLLTGTSLRTLRAVHTPLSDDQGTGHDWLTGDGYGYGHFIGSIGGHAAYLQPGDVPGYKSFSAWLPQHAASIVILANNETVDMENLLRQVLPAALKPPAWKVSGSGAAGRDDG